jgi:outer membrane protein
LPAPPPSAGPDASLLAQLPPPGTLLSLRKLVAFALQNSPQTRSSWLNSRAAAAGVVSRRSAYYPTVAAQVQAGYTHTAIGGTTVFDGFTLTPGASLSYLLLDLGGRSADIEEAEALLDVANLSHNRTVQDVVLNVEQAYFQYVSAKALVAANEDTLKETQTAFQAAEERRNAGVATVADVLQAKTLVSQARLALQQNQGQVIALRGALATSLGVPANLPVDVGELPAELPLRPLEEAVEKLIAEAQAKRPDLARARARGALREVSRRLRSSIVRKSTCFLPRDRTGRNFRPSLLSTPSLGHEGGSCRSSAGFSGWSEACAVAARRASIPNACSPPVPTAIRRRSRQ